METKKTSKPQYKFIAYKGFDKDFKCRGFQYEVGGEYTHEGDVVICRGGFHACEHPLEVFGHYSPARSRFAVVAQSGELRRDGTKVVSRHITVKAEIDVAGLVKAAIENAKARSGPICPDSSASATGDYGAASATNFRGVAFATGRYGAASATGICGAASATGYQGAAFATGDCGAASATDNYGAASATSYRGAASATGICGAASATSYHGAASATGDCGAASATGYHGAASATGDCGAASATGDCGAASATGDHGAAFATGDCGAASATGDHGAAFATGYRSAASATGYHGAASATGDHGVATAAGIACKAKGAEGCALFLVYRHYDCRILHAKAVIVGQDGVLPDTWYRLNENGELETAESP